MITFLDEKGLCSIVPDASDPYKGRSASEICWRLLRREIDGCTDTICDCKASDVLYTRSNDDLETILNGFIKAAEDITDSRNFISADMFGPFRLSEESMNDAALHSIDVYFNSFICIYSDRAHSESIKKHKEIMKLRVGKFDAAKSNHNARYIIWTTGSMLALTAAALTISVISLLYSLGVL